MGISEIYHLPSTDELLGVLVRIAVAAALGALLGEERISHAARNALEAIPGREAGAGLRDALGKTSQRIQVGVIDSLGRRREPESLSVLKPLLDEANLTFRIGTLRVNYAHASLIEGDLANGALVEVQGPRASGLTLIARKVNVEDGGLGGEPGEGGSIEGLVTSPLDAGFFAINGQVIIIKPTTVFEDGGRADLVNNARVEAEGRFDAKGRIVAEKVKIEHEDDAYVLRVVGNSMVDDDITDGDLVLVERSSTARDGEIVVAVVDGEATLKRYYREADGSVRLQPANASMQAIHVQPPKQLEIRGIVRGVLRRY